MEYDEEDNGADGVIPEFGAIFMSSALTKKECFKHKVFALPSSKAAFVKRVKTGMVLFLFEFETRKLFGVYQAVSDGTMDIVPHAFNYSGRHFPAQVCFTPIWYCNPLSEKEFQDAIRENYFSTKKFNFGLSENQVRRLLSLFSSRKLKSKMPPHLPAEIDVGVADKHRGLVGGDGFALNKRAYMESISYEEFNPDTFSDYHVNSLAREEEVLLDDGDDTKGKTHTLPQGNFLSKRRRLGHDDRLITNDVKENVYDYGSLRTFGLDSSEDSLDDEIRRLDDARRLLRIESIRNEEKLDRMFSHVLSSETSLDVTSAANDSFMHRNRLFGENNNESSSQVAFETECYQKSLEKRKYAIDDERFLFDDCPLREEHKHPEIVKPMAYSRGSLNLHQQARETRDAHPYRKMEDRYHLDCDWCPDSASEYSSGLLHKVRKRSPCGRFLVNDRIESKSNVGTLSPDGFSSGNCSRPLHCGQNIIHDALYPIGEGRVTENMVNGTFCSATSTRNTESMANFDRKVLHGRFRESERLDNEENVRKLSRPIIPMGYPSFSKQKQSFSSFSEKLVPAEKGPSQLTAAYHDFDCPRATFDDATITRAVPCTPENPKFSHGCSASMAADRKFSLMLENHPRHCSVGNSFSLSKNRASACLLDVKNSSKSLDISPKYGNEVLPTNTSDPQHPLLHEGTQSLQNSNLSMQMNLNTSSVNYRGSVFPKLFSSLPSTDCENIEGEKGVLFANSTKLSENQFAFDGSRPMASPHASEHRQYINMVSGQDFIHSEAKDLRVGVHHPERNLLCYEDKYLGVSSYNLKDHPEISETPDFNSNVIRRSVFTRLSSRQETQVGEERHEIDPNCHDHYMDATADEVIEMLQQGGQPSVVKEKQSQSLIEMNNPGMEKKMVNDVLFTAFAESIDEGPKETRLVNFKRRSDTRKKLLGTSTKTAADNKNKVDEADGEVKSSQNKTSKRRKLIRPVFGKIEPTADAICSNQNSHLVSQVLDKDNKRPHEKGLSDCEAEMPNDDNSSTNQSAECSIKELSNPEKQKDIGAHLLPSANHKLIGHKTPNVGLLISSSQSILKETTEHKSSDIQTASLEGVLSEDADANVSSLNLQESSELKGSDIQTASLEGVLSKDADANVCSLNLQESSEHKSSDIRTASLEGVLSKDADANVSSLNLLESSEHKSSDIQTASLEGVLSKDADANITSLNLPESSSEVPNRVADCGTNKTKKKRKRKKRVKSSDIRTASLEGVLSKDADANVSSLNLLESSEHKSSDIQTASLEGVLSKDADANINSLNLQESSSEVPNCGADCGTNKTKKKRKRKKRVKKKVRRPKKKAIEPTQ